MISDSQSNFSSPSDGKRNRNKVVISGMSGAYPTTNHVKGLADILYNKVNPISEERSRKWNLNYPGLPHIVGTIPDLDKFDAQFFKVHYKLGNSMDPMSRVLLEQVYQAIFDAGYSPEHLRGRKIAVYMGLCLPETEKYVFYTIFYNGLGIIGCNKSMFANRVSYWLDAKGPSLSIDAACSSSIVALEKAYQSISSGDCEAAIVAGGSLCLHPHTSVHYGKILPMNLDGKTRSFDKNANGHTRSDVVNVLFLQRAEDAQRIYADVCYVKTKFTPLIQNNIQRYGPYRDEAELVDFMKTFYNEAQVSPNAVEYVEAFGSANPEADKTELEAIEKVYCNRVNNKDPLYVGSVMSNIGFGEAASGISSITKVCLAYHTGKISANLHCDNPRDDVMALNDGRMRVVTEHQKFGRTYTAVNSLALTGLTGQVLLHGHYKPKNLDRYKTHLPYLLTLSSRQETGVNMMIDELTTNAIDPEQIALLHNIHENNIPGHLGRGYAILGQNENKETVLVSKKVGYFDDAKRPLCFVYSGMGSQWVGMGKQLMRIPIFAAAIKRCDRVLKPKGLDIVNIISSDKKEMFDNILHSFVGIAAMQIGLTDILIKLGLVPDLIIGHSVGELGCAYADNCLTAEEMILAAYGRGLVSLETKFIRGSMAAVGVGFQQISAMCPSDIEVACHNGPESSTISGPAVSMKEFVASLTAKGIFAKEVPCSNIAYHSRYIRDAGPKLLSFLKTIIVNPKKRSEKWWSTSVPQDRWNTSAAQLCSAEYHTNNLLNPVLFEETSRLIPNNAVLVEVAPHGLLQAILKRSLSENCVNITLTRRGHADSVTMLLGAVGSLYMVGYNPKIKELYPKIEFPVSTGTPMLSHFAHWVHNETWSVASYIPATRTKALISRFVLTTCDDEYKYLENHIFKGETRFPFAQALEYVWNTLSMSAGFGKYNLSVQFNDVHLFEQPIMSEDYPLKINCSINKGNGYFEVNNENMMIVSGYVHSMTKALPEITAIMAYKPEPSDTLILGQDDVYKTLYERGFTYRGDFKSIQSINTNCNEAEIRFNDNWVLLLDSMIQMNALRQYHCGISQVKFIRQLCICINEHNKEVDANSVKTSLQAYYFQEFDKTRCGGVIISGIKFNDLPPSIDEISLNTQNFVPFFGQQFDNVYNALSVIVQIVSENINKESINVVEISKNNDYLGSIKELVQIIQTTSGIVTNVVQINDNDMPVMFFEKLRTANLIVTADLEKNTELCKKLKNYAVEKTFVLNLISPDVIDAPSVNSSVVASIITSMCRMNLEYWKTNSKSTGTSYVSVDSEDNLEFLEKTRKTLHSDQNLVIITEKSLSEMLKTTVKNWRQEKEKHKIFVAKINTNNFKENSPDFRLAFNVFKNGVWGGEYVLPCQEKTFSDFSMSLRSTSAGNIESLKWAPAIDETSDSLQIKVFYAGLNIRDAKRATGSTPWQLDNEFENGYGMDFSGINERGERVMGLMRGGAASTHVSVDEAVLWPVPESWNLEDAATVPLPYMLAFYCLFVRGNLTPGMSILVQSGAGALGQAIISIALAHNCQVFTTVSESKKKHFLRKIFPSLPANQIGYSRDTLFKDVVLGTTNGKGCDLVICSAKGEIKEAFFNCVANGGGTLLDTGLVDMTETSEYGMSHMTAERHFKPAVFSGLFINNNARELKYLQQLVGAGINAGYVVPIARVTVDAKEAVRGLRLLLGGRLCGRMLLRIRPNLPQATPAEEAYAQQWASRLPTKAEWMDGHTYLTLFNGSHVIFNDQVTTFGLKFAEKLISRGASNIVIYGEKEDKFDGHMLQKLKTWRGIGVNVSFVNEKLNANADLNNLFEETMKRGPVEGVYMIVDGNTGILEDKATKILTNIDETTRTTCKSLKYFAVISEHLRFGEEICKLRQKDNLPSKLVIFDTIEKYENSKATPYNRFAMSVLTALYAVERAIMCDDTIISVQAKKKHIDCVDKKIISLTGLNILSSIYDDVKLKDLGIDELKALDISDFFGSILHVNVKDPSSLTIAGLRDMLKKCKMQESINESGLNAFFSHVDPDELYATTEMVKMQTQTSQAKVVQRDAEFQPDQSYLTIIPGLDGQYGRFQQLCERLNIPAVVLQPGFDYPYETVPEIAQRLVANLKKMIHLKENFYILGYSFGTLVALEMAAILEKEGLTGTIYCIDGAPDTFTKLLQKQVPSSLIELQDSIILHMYNLMTNSTNTNNVLATNLKTISNWKDKVDLCLRDLSGKISHSMQYARCVIEAAYGRIEQAQKYDASNLKKRLLNSRVVVLNASEPPSSDLGLSKYVLHPPTLYPVEAGHASVLEHLVCAYIINKHLGSEILEKYANMNYCEAYLINAETYISTKKDDPGV